MSAPKPRVYTFRDHHLFTRWFIACPCGFVAERNTHEVAVDRAIAHSRTHIDNTVARTRATLKEAMDESITAALDQRKRGWCTVADANEQFAYGIKWALKVIDHGGERPW